MRKIFLTAALLAVSCLAQAQSWPTKPIRLVVPFAPGGSSSIVARSVAHEMEKGLGQSIIIDNRPGGGGNVAMQEVARAEPDGYTLIISHIGTFAVNPFMFESLPFDTNKDFAPVSLLAKVPNIFVVHADVPAKDMREFIALVKKQPGKLYYGSAGNGSYVHLSMALMASMAGVNMVHVPYKGGGPVNVAIASGEVQAVLATIGSLTANLNAKRVRPLGVSSAKRTNAYPDVPAIAEFVPGYEFTAWVGCFVPAGTPKPIVDTLNGLIAKALADKDVASKLSAQTLDPMHMTSDQFAARIKSDYDKYAKVVKISGAKVD